MCMVWEWQKHGIPPEIQQLDTPEDTEPRDKEVPKEGSG